MVCCGGFHIEYPKSATEQKKIAKEFEEKSEVGFSTAPVVLMEF